MKESTLHNEWTDTKSCQNKQCYPAQKINCKANVQVKAPEKELSKWTGRNLIVKILKSTTEDT